MLPAEAEQLPFPHPRGQRQHDQGFKTVPACRRQETPRLLWVIHLHLLLRHPRRLHEIGDVAQHEIQLHGVL
ncbi:MAG TPA: hypothetical protein VGP82_05205 [Ktedonobacterales bacterium]|jgi:hypothetical protein|nr:hypothetical protein [Ktedonobacterales bacterium]